MKNLNSTWCRVYIEEMVFHYIYSLFSIIKDGLQEGYILIAIMACLLIARPTTSRYIFR